jgi:hypothetical protein
VLNTEPCVALVGRADPSDQLKQIGVAKVITICVRHRSRSCYLRLLVWANASPHVSPLYWFRVDSALTGGSLDPENAQRLLRTPPYRYLLGFIIAGELSHYRIRQWVEIARARFISYREVRQNGHYAEIDLRLTATDGRRASVRLLVSGSLPKFSCTIRQVDDVGQGQNGHLLSAKEVRRMKRRKAATTKILGAIPLKVRSRL